ncbi:MAG: C-terminal binding protein [Chloroflexi bacterium]|nr:C-terminal binding protein [Chloroflexota bacterium]
MPGKVVCTAALVPHRPDHFQEIVEKAGFTFERKVVTPPTNEDGFIAALKDADVAISSPLTRKIAEALPKLRAVCSPAVGYDRIDVGVATEHGIIVSNNADYCLDEVTDHAVALMLTLARRILPLDKQTKTGKGGMAAVRPLMGGVHRLRGQTLGLVGFGRIPRTLVPKAQGFGMRVIMYDPHLTRDVGLPLGVDMFELDDLLAQSDFVSLHAALGTGSRGMMGMEQLKKMKKTAYLVNCGRGGLVKEAELAQALQQGLIAGAGLDVTDPEPPVAENPLCKMDNVLLTSHQAFFSEESERDLGFHAGDEAVRVLQGLWPLGFVNPGVQAKYNAKWAKK